MFCSEDKRHSSDVRFRSPSICILNCCLAATSASFRIFFFFYLPPTFAQKKKKRRRKEKKKISYISSRDNPFQVSCHFTPSDVYSISVSPALFFYFFFLKKTSQLKREPINQLSRRTQILSWTIPATARPQGISPRVKYSIFLIGSQLMLSTFVLLGLPLRRQTEVFGLSGSVLPL